MTPRLLRPASAVPVLLAVLFAAGAACGGPAEDPRPAPDVTAPDSAIQLVDEEDADLHLWISNQSFDDETVTIKVVIDDVTVVDDEFAVEGQHNWIEFPLAVPPGEHRITAESDSGATLVEEFRLPGDKPRYAVIDHWGRGESAELTWRIQRQPLAFA